jgi:hypothetical protein
MEIRVLSVGGKELSLSGAEVIKHCNLIVLKQPFQKVAADEACTTGDENGSILKHRVRISLYDYQDYGPRLQAYLFHLSLLESCFVLAAKCDLAAKVQYDSVRLELSKFGFKELASCESSRLC